MTSKQFDPSRFTINPTKPLPVLLLLDVSGSMNEVIGGSFERTGQTVVEDGRTWEIVRGGVTRIEILNQAVKEMIEVFAREEQLEHEILVSIVTFGDGVRVQLPPTKASRVAFQPLTAAGETPLGEAITTAKRLIEDKESTPSRAYRPVVVLVSDGKPTDRWEESLEAFVGAGRSSKCDRVALAIGENADEDMLRKFIAGTPNPLFHAADAGQLLETFRRVTMSVSLRTRSKDPNQIPGLGSVPAAPTPASTTVAKSAPEPAAKDDDEGYW